MELLRLSLFLLLLGIYSLNSQAIDNSDSHKNNNTQILSGSYKVKAIHYIYADTTYKVDSLDYGRFLFTDKNYALQYNPMMSRRAAFKILSQPDNEEIINAFRTVVFNSGSYVIKDDIIHARPDIAKVPGFENGHQYYKMELKNNLLRSLTMFDETYPNGEKPNWHNKLQVKFILEKE